ncbi:MAG: hypothetical protein NZM35_05365 [Chitinophagales bacterium]|nr:hypothetical protein [Chitinophagales bacterium]MDW8418541.1 hypothetical protein [Chitinophagales bacterium]
MHGFVFYFSILLFTCHTSAAQPLTYPAERHLRNVRQLTYGGDNAEAYWSNDGQKLTYQRTDKKRGIPCDQIWMLDLSAGTEHTSPVRISNGHGRTTCSYFLPGDTLILFASTHHSHDTCPAEPERVRGKYVWPLYPEYELYIADLKGNIVRRLTNNSYYDAEATVSPKGDKIIFTSTRTGDPELYIMNIDGSGVRQITNRTGYDGGAFFSPNGKKIVWRSTRFDSDSEVTEYKKLLEKGLVSPNKMELYMAKANGKKCRKITQLGGANWAPFFHPSGKKIIFSSNHATQTIPFNLYMINTDGSGLEQITYDPIFDAFPMFSPDGKKLVWCSNRNNNGTRDTNIFVGDWVE